MAHVVAHTHWDREWVVPFEVCRVRLVTVMDRLLALLEQRRDFTSFHLDGQTVVLEDYLAVRPEQRERLQRLVRAGRLIIGPWYTLPDEFLVSGEALVRNLLVGRALGRAFGGWMPVGYLPDMFGHIAQMPQILRGFGIDAAVVWRGTPHGLPNELLWEGLDGTRVFAVKLSDEGGYMAAQDLPYDADAAWTRLEKELARLRSSARTRHVLLLNGVDQACAQENLPEVLAGLNGLQRGVRFIQDSLPRYVRTVRKAGSARPVIRGEQRTPNSAFTWKYLLGGVAAARPDLKRENHACQALLERCAEPFAVVASLLGEPYPFVWLDRAWKTLLLNHAHDSICGCSVEEVHLEMQDRFRRCRQITSHVAGSALGAIGRRIATTGVAGEGEKAVVIFNPCAFDRGGCFTVDLDLPASEHIRTFALTTPDGAPVAYTVLSRRPRVQTDVGDLRPLPPARPRMIRWQVRLQLPVLPALGYTTLRLVPHRDPAPAASLLHWGPRWAETECLRLEIHRNGTFTLRDKTAGTSYEGLGIVVDDGDAGNEYRYIAPAEDRVVSSKGCTSEVRLIRTGPLDVVFEVGLALRVPKRLNRRGTARVAGGSVCRITSWITMSEGCPWVEVCTRVENRAVQHRLRMLFPMGIRAERYSVETPFGAVDRRVSLPDEPNWKERRSDCGPCSGWLDISGAGKALAMMHEGACEAGVEDDARGTVTLTLLRSVASWLQKSDSDAAPGAACLGDTVRRFALMPHRRGWEADAVPMRALDFTTAPCAAVLPRQGGSLPSALSFVRVSDPRVQLSALKWSEDGRGVIVRLVNHSRRPVRTQVTFARAFRRVDRVDMGETRRGVLTRRASRTVRIALKAFEVLTLRADFGVTEVSVPTRETR